MTTRKSSFCLKKRQQLPVRPMSKNRFRITPYAHDRLKFVVSSHIGGHRERKFFETKRKAVTYLELKEIELLNQGVEGATFSTELRVLAQRATNILNPFGKTVLDAAEFYARHLQSISSSRSVAEVVRELLDVRKSDGLSADYINDLKIKFRAFAEIFGNRMIADITSKEISD
ncbi:MAG: hypothetical protein ABI318_11605 [Chthoniobacteraceae bacterium]